jgi:hypothetical protein
MKKYDHGGGGCLSDGIMTGDQIIMVYLFYVFSQLKLTPASTAT